MIATDPLSLSPNPMPRRPPIDAPGRRKIQSGGSRSINGPSALGDPATWHQPSKRRWHMREVSGYNLLDQDFGSSRGSLGSESPDRTRSRIGRIDWSE